jgi:N-methylhydantoinase A
VLRLGVDVGGTFTDLLLHDTGSGHLWLAKVPSTPQDQSLGVLDGIRTIAAVAGVAVSDLGTILHGTTVATNAVLEKRGARVGLLTSEGFRWILHLAEAWTPGPLFGWMIYEKPEPIAAVEDTRALTERVAADGSVLRALDETSARSAIAELRDRGVEAMTVSLLNSFANPAHERVVAQLVREEAPALPVSISSEVLPEFREYERTVTTVVNAYVSPVLDRYLSNLRDRLQSEGTRAELRVVRSDGGLMSLDSARSTPVHTVLSGPAGGVQGAAYVATRAGRDTILTFDMGGNLDRRRHLLRRCAGDHPRDRGGRVPGAGAVGRRGEHRGGRRFDRLRRGGDRRTPGRAAQRRRGPGSRVLREGRHRTDRHRRQRGARPPAAPAPRWRDGARH